MNTKAFILFIMALFIINCNISGQFFYNNGAEIAARQGAIVKVKGSVCNSNNGILENQGLIEIDDSFTNNANTYGDGDYFIAGDWLNNGVFYCGNSDVVLNGSNQSIGGNIPTFFYNLELAGSGIKNLLINSYINNYLNLNDRELSTGNFIIYIENSSTNAIQRTTGFVSSLASGSLNRKTSANAVYLFPVGSSLNTLRYRPVEITPLNDSINNYSVRMANVDATLEGFDRNALGADLCITNPLFFHLIDRTSGNSNADITIYFDTIADGNWKNLANWQSNPAAKWNKLAPVQQIISTPLSSLSYYNWDNFSNKAFILSKNFGITSINPVAPLCQNNKPIYLIASDAGGLWNGNGIISANNGFFDPSSAGAGTHQIIYTLQGLCAGADTTFITVYPNAIITASVTNESCDGANDGSIAVTATGGTPTYIYNWNGGQYMSDYIYNLQPGVYYIVVTDANGCQAGDSFEVYGSNEICYTPHAVLPNIFSPNGDGQNDILYVRGQGIDYINFMIYDRWGTKIFETTDVTMGWDGKFNGIELNSGSYVYYFKALLKNDKIIEDKGTITLIK